MAQTTEEKTTFGVTIVRPTSPDAPAPAVTATNTNNLSAPGARPSIPLLHTTSHDSDCESGANTPLSPHYDSVNPFSPFYQHPESRSHLEVNRSRYDLEAQSPAASHLDVSAPDFPSLSAASTVAAPKVSVDGRVKECTVWPTKQTLDAKAKAQKRQRGHGCQCWRAMNRRQKLGAKLLIALTVIALAVGLSVGISRAVGGGVWAGDGESSTIPKDGS